MPLHTKQITTSLSAVTHYPYPQATLVFYCVRLFSIRASVSLGNLISQSVFHAITAGYCAQKGIGISIFSCIKILESYPDGEEIKYQTTNRGLHILKDWEQNKALLEPYHAPKPRGPPSWFP